MILVVDITKGIQTQTAECLVIGEILCPRIVVVLNKVDQLPENKKEVMIEKVLKDICIIKHSGYWVLILVQHKGFNSSLPYHQAYKQLATLTIFEDWK